MSDLIADLTTEAKADCARIGGTLLFSFVFLSGCVFDPSGIGESGLNNIQDNNNNHGNNNNANGNNANLNMNNNGNNGPGAECGNGLLEGDDECDDGNLIDGDGCSSACTIEENFACWGEPSVCVCRVHVNANNISSTSDGASFNTGFLTVQEGIDRAVSLGECEVWVAGGVYHVYETDGSNTIALADNVAVYGGFAGSETARPERDWLANETVLSGRQESIPANRARNVVTASGAGNTILDGFIITGGNADVFSTNGGGLLCKNSNITIANCIFQGNNANQDGGGVYLEDCHAHVLQTVFTGNSALSDGGGVATDGGSVFFDECEFRLNTVTWYGGGIYISASTVSEIRNSDFHENNANRGGGIYTNGGAPEILDSGFYKNTATAPYGGAGFHANYGDIAIRRSTFEENSSPRGAGVYFHDANGSVEASWFEGNTTSNYGGALYFRYCNNVELVNLVIWSNTSNEGGAVLNFECDLRVVNSTLYGNTAHSTGGAFYSWGASAVTTIINSILWNGSPNEITNASGSSTPVHYSNVSQTGYAGTNNNINADPKFANPATGDFRLQSDSPCIGSANGTQAPAFDIEGNPRSSDTPDMGAYEYSN